MNQLHIIKLRFNNPTPMVRYLGKQNNCNTPLSKAARFTKEEAELLASGINGWPGMTAEIVPVKETK